MSAIDPERQGKCYPLAFDHLMANDDGVAVLVHGSINGGTVDHAWVQWPDTVYDPVVDEEFTLDYYYEHARAEPAQQYTADEAEQALENSGHYGPWEG